MANTGKTFTMFGDIDKVGLSDQNPGWVLLQLKELFWQAQMMKRSEKKKFRLKISFIEIYDNKVYDLLSPSTGIISMIEDANKGLLFPKISETEMDCLATGIK